MQKFEKPKDPDDIDFYSYDWIDYLAGNPEFDEPDTIATGTVTVVTGTVSLSGATHDGRRQIVRVSGGTAGETAELRFRITTTAGRQKDFTVALDIATA